MNDTLLRHWRMLHRSAALPRVGLYPVDLKRLVAAGFEASLRTIQRDLVKLSATLPLLADDSKPQGWSWEANTPQLDLPTLEPQAALVFHRNGHLSAIAAASQYAGFSIAVVSYRSRSFG